MRFELEIHNERGRLRVLKYPMKPTIRHCVDQIEENDGTYGYLVTIVRQGTWKSTTGGETERRLIRCPTS